MKLLAHSLVPPTPTPYLHLGYVAAAPMQLESFGHVFLLLAIVVGLYLRSQLWQRSRKLATGLFMLLLLVGIAGDVRFYIKARHERPRTATRINAVKIINAFREAVIQDGKSPSDFPVLLQDMGQRGIDGWGQSFRVERQGSSYALHSSGADRLPNTDDDFTLNFVPPETDMVESGEKP